VVGINLAFRKSAGQKVYIYAIVETGDHQNDLGHRMGGGDGRLRFGHCFTIKET